MAAPSIPQRRKPPPPPQYEEEEEVEEDKKVVEKEDEYKMHRFTDGDENMAVKEFFELYSSKLPKAVVVSQGQYGEIDLDTFCAGQVMFIHSYASQSRVIARDVRGRTFSIPADYPMKFKVVKSRTKEGEEQSLQEIIDENQLPLQVKFSVPPHVTFYIGPDQQKAKDLSNLVLVAAYDETYMLANCINTKRLDKKTVLVPVYLQDALLSMVTGVEDQTEEFWLEYEASLVEEMKTITVDIKIGNKDIAFISDECLEVEDNVYDYIEPKNFLKMSVVDETGYGVIMDDPDSIYSAVDEDEVEVPVPPLPQRQTQKEKKPAPKAGKAGRPEVPSRNKLPESDDPKTGSTEAHGYVNDIPRTEVAPFKILRGLGKGKKDSHDKTAGETIDNISVKDLSIIDLGKKMKELKLGKHVGAFKKQAIDGRIAAELTKEILQSDFGFSPVEAIKMMQFITDGHIPR